MKAADLIRRMEDELRAPLSEDEKDLALDVLASWERIGTAEGEEFGEHEGLVGDIFYAYLVATFVKRSLTFRKPVSLLLHGAALKLVALRPRMTERQYVERLLDFVNIGALTDGRQVELLTGMRLDDDHAFSRSSQFEHSQVDEIRERVHAFHADPGGVRRSLVSAAVSRVNNAAIALPVVSEEGAIDSRYLFESIEAALAFAEMLLLDPRRPFGEQLCHCTHESCYRYFLAWRGADNSGRYVRKYCSVAHREETRELQNVSRVQRFRERQKQKSRKKRKQA